MKKDEEGGNYFSIIHFLGYSLPDRIVAIFNGFDLVNYLL